jgi:Relaxase/Mobilisation nuclease domain
MIGKTTKGNNFDRLLNYIERKPEAQYVGGNMIGTTRTELVKEFQAIAKRSYRARLPVAHISLSPHPDEKLDDSLALDFAQSYLNKIHFGDCQWVLYRHNDTKTPEEKERPHFHIVANRVRITDGKAVSSWQDWRRSELALRELEKEFGLLQVQSSWETERSAPSTGQQRRYKREKKQYLAGQRDSPPEKAVKSQIQDILDRETSNYPTLPETIKLLQQANVLTCVEFTNIGKVKGISYQFKGVSFSGSQLGKAYTFGGLQKYRNVNYEPERDDQNLRELMHLKPASFKPTPELTLPFLVHSPSELPKLKSPIDLEQKALAEQLYPHAWRLFQDAKHRGMVKEIGSGVFCFKRENYALVHDESCPHFCVLHQERGELLNRKPGELVSAQGIEFRDIVNFLQFVKQEQQRHRKPSKSKSSEIER